MTSLSEREAKGLRACAHVRAKVETVGLVLQVSLKIICLSVVDDHVA